MMDFEVGDHASKQLSSNTSFRDGDSFRFSCLVILILLLSHTRACAWTGTRNS